MSPSGRSFVSYRYCFFKSRLVGTRLCSYYQLVHDYWAANVWALYLFTSRVVTFIIRKTPIVRLPPVYIRDIIDYIIPFPEPQPSLVALFLVIGLWPGGIRMAWKIGSRSLVDPRCNGGRFFIHAVVSDIDMIFHILLIHSTPFQGVYY